MGSKKTSNFINPEVWLYNDAGAFNITDITISFKTFLHYTTPFQGLELRLSLSSDKIAELDIGYFKEKYVVILELFDSSQNSIQDTIVFNMSPYDYEGYDISILSKHMNNNDNHGSIDLTVKLLNENTRELFNVYSAIHINKKYKDIYNCCVQKMGVPIKEKDKPYSEVMFQEFFAPTARKYDHLNYVLNKGFINKTCGDIGTFLMTNEGLVTYRTEISKTRKILKAELHPTTTGTWQDFQDMFITHFKLERFVDTKLNVGHRVPYFTTAEARHKYKVVKNKMCNYKNKLMLPKAFTESRSRVYDINAEYEQADFSTSVDDAYRNLHHIKLTLSRWKKFEHLIPVRHIIDLKFTPDLIKDNSDKYIIKSNEITVTREGNEFIAKCELDLILFKIK